MDSLTPYFIRKPWGGHFISRHFGLSEEKIGEALILSTLPGQETNREGAPLSAFLGKKLSCLIKIIDAIEPLSIQVHPDDSWAEKLENSKGKSECWLVLSASPGAGVYLGLKPGIADSDFRAALHDNGEIDQLLNFHPVKRGDFISVPAGTIHAIGGGLTILEVQQASGITYRLWDWGRTDRELHLEKGLMVSDFSLCPPVICNVFDDPSPRTLFVHRDFEIFLNEAPGQGWFIDLETLAARPSHTSRPGSFVFVKQEG